MQKPFGGGATSEVRRFQLDEEYDEFSSAAAEPPLSDDSMSNDGSVAALRRSYVMKCLKGKESNDYYHTEKTAYRKLRQINHHSENFLCLYGSFQWDGKRFLIFDVADMGTLEDYMSNNKPPEDIDEICEIWTRFLTLVKAMWRIHNVEIDDDDNRKTMAG